MNKVNRLLINIVTDHLKKSATFYTKHFDFEINYESDWFIHLISKDKSQEIGFINPSSEVVPNGLGNAQNGLYLTFVIDDVDVFFASIETESVTILKPPHDTFYGQRRLLIEDTNGLYLDISSPTSV